MRCFVLELRSQWIETTSDFSVSSSELFFILYSSNSPKCKWSSFEVWSLHGARNFHNESQNTPFDTVDLCSVTEQMSVEEHAIFIISQHLVIFLLHLPSNTECRVQRFSLFSKLFPTIVSFSVPNSCSVAKPLF